MGKAKMALYSAAGCGGCDVAVLDTGEKLLHIAARADFVFWPAVLDFKYRHVESMADGEIDLCLISGAVRDSEQERSARLLRARSKSVIAFGTCACYGGVPALADLSDRAALLARVFLEAPSNANEKRILPQTLTGVGEGELRLPEFRDSVSSLDQVIPVDYFLPGCPPPADVVLKTLEAFLDGDPPPEGSVIASDRTLCEECDRVKEEKRITRIYRPHEIIPDPRKCLLDVGVICCGPATRGGCGAPCLKANMPCRGCLGPPPGVTDQGARMLGAIASVYEAREDGEIARLVEEVVDPAGTFYRFGLAKASLRPRCPAPERAGVR